MRMSEIVGCLILLVVASVESYGKYDKDKYGGSSDSLSNAIHRTSLVRSGYHGGHHVIHHGHIGRPIVHNGLMDGYFGVQHSGSHDFGSGHVAGPVIHAHHLSIVHHVHHVVSPVVYPHHHFGHVVVERHHRHHHRRHRKKKGSSSGSSSNSS